MVASTWPLFCTITICRPLTTSPPPVSMAASCRIASLARIEATTAIPFSLVSRTRAKATGAPAPRRARAAQGEVEA
jgi:hypothetical protein